MQSVGRLRPDQVPLTNNMSNRPLDTSGNHSPSFGESAMTFPKIAYLARDGRSLPETFRTFVGSSFAFIQLRGMRSPKGHPAFSQLSLYSPARTPRPSVSVLLPQPGRSSQH